MSEDFNPSALLVLPHLRIQNANAISAPMTWGFPSMTAFVGLMQALERKLAGETSLQFLSVGVVCHHFQAQASRDRYTYALRLTRNPVDDKGDTAAIVEEGRIHLELTLIFGVHGDAAAGRDAEQHAAVVRRVGQVLAGMRVAGGSVMPALPGRRRRRLQPYVAVLPSGNDGDFFRQLRRQWLPGFALVSRDDLLQAHHAQLRQARPDATLLDTWLDAARLNLRADHEPVIDRDTGQPAVDAATGEPKTQVAWNARRLPGWVVPIPVGYGALEAEAHAPGSVAGARDRRVPFRFVESLYSLGQWISPHRLQRPSDLLWSSHADIEAGLYRCVNRYRAASLAAPDTASN